MPSQVDLLFEKFRNILEGDITCLSEEECEELFSAIREDMTDRISGLRARKHQEGKG
jgi:hypothetical protein